MMNKSAATTHTLVPTLAGLASAFCGILARMRNVVRIDIPVAYQDETGFHYGVKPAEKEMKWPPVW